MILILLSLTAKTKKNRKVLHFNGGRLSQFVNEWQAITYDTEILNTVSGLELNFNCKPSQLCLTKQHPFSAEEAAAIDSEQQNF